MFCPGKNPRSSLHFDFRENNGWQGAFAFEDTGTEKYLLEMQHLMQKRIW
jgi:hypothetical protein